MKIYLASSFRFKINCIELMNALHGYHDVTCKWWEKDFKEITVKGDFWYFMPEIKAIFQRTFAAIKESEIVILVTPEETKFNGANVEVGIALALGKPVIAYGKLEKSGMYEPLIKCPTIQSLHSVLREFSR